MTYLSPKRFPHLFRRIAALTLVATLTICSLGIPLPHQVKNPADQPYPCMNCPCGCENAEACWRDCCCFSQQEKLAWAKENGVTPPAFVSVAVEKPSCCSKPACCSKHVAKASCCSQKKSPSCCGGSSACGKRPSRQRRTPSNVLVMFQALRCQGLIHSLTLLPPSVVPAQPISANLLPPTGEKIPLRDDLLLPEPFLALDTPPPECAA